jgi:hypothetical protein
MNVQIIVGVKKNGAVFFNIVENITISKKYSSLLKITGNSHSELIDNMIKQRDDVNQLKLSNKITFSNGWVRSETTNKMRRCEPLNKKQLEKTKEIFSLLQKETKTTKEIELEVCA